MEVFPEEQGGRTQKSQQPCVRDQCDLGEPYSYLELRLCLTDMACRINGSFRLNLSKEHHDIRLFVLKTYTFIIKCTCIGAGIFIGISITHF